MKKLIFAVVLCCSNVKAWGPPDGAMTTTGDTRTVSVSSGTPTLLLTRDSFIQGNLLVNLSTCAVFISSSAASVTTSSFKIMGSSASAGIYPQFSPDGVNSPFWGALYGRSTCASNSDSSMTIFRSK